MTALGILSVDLTARHVTLTDGQRIPITNWLCGQEELPGPDGASTFVAGPCADGRWYAAEIEEDDSDDQFAVLRVVPDAAKRRPQ